MKSWISFLLPDDEYKERKIMQFLSESSILLLFYLIALIAAAQIFPGWNSDVELAAGGGIGIFSFYVCGRYILSGIEYTDVTTEKRFAKEKMLILQKLFIFVFIFLGIYSVLIGIPDTMEEWTDIAVILVSASLLMSFSSYISLKRSYRMNRELEEEE